MRATVTVTVETTTCVICETREEYYFTGLCEEHWRAFLDDEVRICHKRQEWCERRICRGCKRLPRRKLQQ